MICHLVGMKAGDLSFYSHLVANHGIAYSINGRLLKCAQENEQNYQLNPVFNGLPLDAAGESRFATYTVEKPCDSAFQRYKWQILIRRSR